MGAALMPRVAARLLVASQLMLPNAFAVRWQRLGRRQGRATTTTTTCAASKRQREERRWRRRCR